MSELVQTYLGTPPFYADQARLSAAAKATQSTAIVYIDIDDGRIELKVDPYGVYECNEVPRVGAGEPPVKLLDENSYENPVVPDPEPEVPKRGRLARFLNG